MFFSVVNKRICTFYKYGETPISTFEQERIRFEISRQINYQKYSEANKKRSQRNAKMLETHETWRTKFWQSARGKRGAQL